MDKNMKALLGINKAIDSDYKKLSDNFHALLLSHNRKKKALEKCLHIAQYIGIVSIIDICNEALFSNGRINERIKNG